MEDWLSRRLARFALKEGMAVAFILSCGLAKILPIIDDGNYKADAVLYMLFFALLYFAWDFAR